jgi:uncharacterized protein
MGPLQMIRKVFLALGLALAAIALLIFVPRLTDVGEVSFSKVEGIFETRAGSQIVFQFELAETPAQQEHGLMFRPSLLPQTGMIFWNASLSPLPIWMKNTKIPLDILFLDDDGRIVLLHPNAIPNDLTPIGVGLPVRAVVEIGGGEAKRLGLRTGDRLRFDRFSK